MDQTGCFVGIDVSKDRLDVYVRPSGQEFALPRDHEGLEQLVERLTALRMGLVVLEATGGFEMMVVAALAAARLPVAVVNPRQIRAFARSLGKLAKTDRLDAQVIALFAERVRPEPRTLPDEHAQTLSDLVARRRQLVEMLGMESNRKLQARDRRIQARIASHVAWLRKALADLDKEMDGQVRSSPAWRETEELLRSVPGIGKVTARTILADLPELGQIDRRRLAALVGVAPMNRDSGRWRGHRAIAGGRSTIRRVLYMATLTAIRRNPTIQSHYSQLRERGLPFKVAIVACMRQLLTILNAIARDRRAWTLA